MSSIFRTQLDMGGMNMTTKRGGERVREWPSAAACVAVLVGTAGMVQSAPSVAQNTTAPYGCACLHNNTQAGIKYRYKWGEGEWKGVSMQPKGAQWMCWRYKDSPKSPELLFQLDVDLTASTKWETFSIKRAQSRETGCAFIPRQAHYHVGYVAGTDKKEVQIFPGK